MSLINQMLKDLEHRGALSSESKLESALGLSPTPIEDSDSNEKKGQLTFLKISGIMALLYLAVYFWIKNPSYHQFITQNVPSVMNTSTNSVAANQPIIIEDSEHQVSNLPNATMVNPNTNTGTTVPTIDTPNSVETNPNQPTSHATVENASASNNAITTDLNVVTTKKEFAKKNKIKPVLVDNQTSRAQNSQLTALETRSSDSINLTQDQNIKAKKANESHKDTDNVSMTKQMRPEQKSANFYQHALNQIQQGRVSEAQSSLVQALEEFPANQEARQTLAALLLDNKRMDDAKNVLKTGLELNPENLDFRMAIARLQVENGDKTGGLNTLNQGIHYGAKDADYQGFFATLLQAVDRHEEAISHYGAALNINGNNSNLLIGQGISLQALGRFEEAQESFTRAQANGSLSADLASFVDQRLKQIKQKLQR